jgi:predicted permease
MQTLWLDLQFGWRGLRNSPSFTSVAVFTLALGIAANTVVFSWIYAVLLRPLPGARDGAQLAAVESVEPKLEGHNISYADFRDYRDHLQLISGIAVSQTLTQFRLGQGDRGEQVWGELVSGNYFQVLGVEPRLGQLFTSDESGDQPGAHPVAVVSDRLWRTYFHAQPTAVGGTIRINGRDLTLIGVTPPEFTGLVRGATFDVWVPLMMGDQLGACQTFVYTERSARGLQGVARLKPGVKVEQARGEIAALAADLARTYPDKDYGISAKMVPEWEGSAGVQTFMRAPLHILMAMALLVLLIACVNVSNLMLARAAARQKELSIRLALGAGAGRLARQLLTESLTLAAIATAASALLSVWLMNSLNYVMPDIGLPIGLVVHMNPLVAGFTVLVCVAAAVAAGLTPAWHAMHTNVNEALKETGRSNSAGSRTHRMRDLFVIAEVGLAMVALVGAGLFTRSFDEARKLNPGFDPHNVLLSRVYLPHEYPPQQQKQILMRMQERLEQTPGVSAVAYADVAPLGFGLGPGWSMEIEGYAPARGEDVTVSRALISPNYLATLRMPLVEGREFTLHDDAGSAPVLIVNQAFVQRYFGGRNAIGRRIRLNGSWRSVVGVVSTAKYYYLTEPARPFFYAPIGQVDLPASGFGMSFFARTKGDPAAAVVPTRHVMEDADPDAVVANTMPLSAYIEAPLFGQRVAAWLLGVLGALSLVLAAVGLYSVMSYSVSQRSHEIGIRIALGAKTADMLGMIVRRGMALAAMGAFAGALAAVASGRLIAGMLTNISAANPGIILVSTLFVGVVALAASLIPVRRASKVDPMSALRD